MSTETCSLIAEQISDALVYSDVKGVISGWNLAAENLFGYARSEAVGQSLDLIIPERFRAAHWAGFDRAMGNWATQYGSRPRVTRSLTSGGNTIYVEMSFAVVTDAQGKAIESVAIARDATQRYLDERSLRERLSELTKNNP